MSMVSSTCGTSTGFFSLSSATFFYTPYLVSPLRQLIKPFDIEEDRRPFELIFKVPELVDTEVHVRSRFKTTLIFPSFIR